MTKQEIEGFLGCQLSEGDFEIIVTVKDYYPQSNHDMLDVKVLYSMFGMRIFHDMYNRAWRAKEYKGTIERANRSLAEL